MKINLDVNISIEVENCNFRELTKSFLLALASLFTQFVSNVLILYFEQYYRDGTLVKKLGCHKVCKKTCNKRTKFKTLFGVIRVPQIQVRVYDSDGNESQKSITRILLEVSPRYQLPDFMKELMGFIGSVSSFRVGHSILTGLSEFKISLTSLWRSAKWYANNIQLGLADDGLNEFEADGTGIPTVNTGKRGSELKKVFQKRQNGKLHLVGISMGKYKAQGGWEKAMSVIKEALNSGRELYERVVLASDGDQAILKAAAKIDSKRLKIQKDKWHIFHQMKYYLWQDKVAKEHRSKIISHFYKLSMLFKRSIKKRDARIKRYISMLKQVGYITTSVYLNSSMEGFYTHEAEGNTNIYTSKTERSMRTTNQRINIGLWSEDGALSVCKIRDAYYYNGISPLNWKECA